MSTKNLRLIRFVKGLLDFLFGLLIFAIMALVLWTALSPLIIGKGGNIGTATVPVTIGVGEEPQFEVSFSSPAKDEIRAAFVEEAEGTLRLETTNFILVLMANAAKLISGIGLAYVFYLLRAVVQATLDGNPFAAENGPRLRRLGYVVLLVGFLNPLVQYIAASEVLNRLPVALPALNPGPTLNAEIILVSLLILILAHIWSYGLELERDKALTI
ncbi:MAG: hypothetical protein GTO14_08315 [Anaerolineales bacterium]|nr:hypothetical protein [Anaerolineales bacterium]